MGYSVDNRLDLSIYFGETEFPIDHSNTVDALIVECMIGTILPTFFLKVTDSIDILQNRGLVRDGQRVTIVVKGPGEIKPRQLSFRIFKSRNQTTQLGSQWLIDGYFDRPRYWLQTSNSGSRDTSAGLIQEICKLCGLRFIGTKTADEQLWLPQNKTWGEWVRGLTAYGYANDTSLMVQGVDLEGVMRYLDFNMQVPPRATLIYGTYEQGQIPVLDYAPSTQSGLTNRITGYNTVMRSQSTVRDSAEHKELVFRPDSREPLLDPDMKAAGKRGYQQFGPLDFGNTHEASERAFYQNKRYANLYNLSVEFMTNVVSGLTLFDTINFIPKSGGGENDSSYGGKYKISAYQMRIEGMTYTEYLCGERHGFNNTPKW